MTPQSDFSLPILVTGASGFIGARVIERLNLLGRPIISVDEPETFALRHEHTQLDFGTRWSIEQLDQFLTEHRGSSTRAFDCIFHMGAISDTTELNEEKLRIRNILASQKLWQYASHTQTPFFYASSAATYGEGENGYQDDESQFDGLRPLNPYGESKRLFDIWALQQEQQGVYPPTWAGFKFFNVYGFGERHKGKMASVVLHAFDQIQSKGTVRLFKSHRDGIADGDQKRDFIWVNDVVDVLFFAWNSGLKRGVYNLGTGRARSFQELVLAVFEALGKPPQIEYIDTPIELRARYQYFTQAEMGRLRQAGYTAPFTSLESGVKHTVKQLLEESMPNQELSK